MSARGVFFPPSQDAGVRISEVSSMGGNVLAVWRRGLLRPCGSVPSKTARGTGWAGGGSQYVSPDFF